MLPVHVLKKVTAPEAAFIEQPPAVLAASMLYVSPEFEVAVAAIVSVPAPLHLVLVVPEVKTGVLTLGFITNAFMTWTDGPLQPLAVAMTFTEP